MDPNALKERATYRVPGKASVVVVMTVPSGAVSVSENRRSLSIGHG